MDKVPWVGNGWVMGWVWVQLSSPMQDSGWYTWVKVLTYKTQTRKYMQIYF